MEPRGRAVPGGTATSPESALASELFDQFVSAGTFKSVLFTYRQICDVLRLKPTTITNFYPRLKTKLHSWRAASLWAKLDKRASHKCYNRGKACPNTRVLLIGAGPCGLRAAIEAQLLGAKVVVVEKRDRFSRNNVLHLWPFVIHDLRSLGAKKFFGKFCAGSIDHISIRQLQIILLKVALLLGVEVHENVGFESLIEPPEDQTQERVGWHARVSPSDHPVSLYEFDVLIGADGKRNTLLGFNRKEFRGKLAIAVTANFINRHTIEEARVPEISGVAFIFNQKFFQDMRDQTAIDLENIVYYKDDTHYFVMTAKKQSLLERRVIIRDFNDTARLLAPENVDREALMEYARDAADFATNYQLPSLDFAVNHYGQADVAMFDFTSMYAAENACRVIEKRGHKLLQGLVGDSLLEPFWPTGSGCARGFLSSFDSAWMIRSWASGKMSTLQVLAEREAIYRLLAQTTPENLSKDLNQYTINPCSRYPNLNLQAVLPSQVRSLYDTDGKIEESIIDIAVEMPKKKKRKESMIHPDTLLNWCQKQVALNDKIKIQDFTSSWKNGLALCAILHRYRPDLIDVTALDPENVAKNNQLAFDICERELGIPPIMTGQEMAECTVPDKLSMVSYISQVYESFRGEIPVVSYSKSTFGEERNTSPNRHHGTPLSVLNRISNRFQSKRKYSVEKEAKDRERGENVKKKSSLLSHKRRSKERGISTDLAKQDVVLVDYQAFPPNKPRESVNTRAKNLEEKLKRDAGLRCHIEEIENAKATRIRSEQTELSIKLLQEQLQKNGSENVKKARTPKVGKLRKDEWNAKISEEKSRQQYALNKTPNTQKPKIIKEIFVKKVHEMDEKLKAGGLTEAEQAKFKQFDEKLNKLKTRLTKGNLETGERGHNQTAAMTQHMTTIWDRKQGRRKDPLPPAPVFKAHTETDSSTSTAGSEICYFCKKHVYVMERLSAEGLFFHRSCFQCEYCSASLRLGNYSFDRDAFCGGKFYCIDHFRKQKADHRTQEIMKRKEAFLSCALEEQQKENLYKTLLDNTEKALSPNKPAQTTTPSTPLKNDSKTPEDQKAEKLKTPSNLLAEPASPYGRDQTPERVEYENSIMEMSEEELLTSELEEEELTQKNLGPSQDLATSDDEYSDLSTDSESDEEAFAEELERSLTADETRKLAETWNRKYSAGHSLIESDSSSSSSSSSADDEESETEIGTDTSDDIDSDAEYSVENSDGSDNKKDKESKNADEAKSCEVKDEFTVEVPIIDLKSMNKIDDDDSESDSEISEEISDSEEISEEGESGTEVDSESEAKAPLPPPQIPTIIIHESPPQDIDLDQKWDSQDPSSSKPSEIPEILADAADADECAKDVDVKSLVQDTTPVENAAISTKDDLVSQNKVDGKLSDTDKSNDFFCSRPKNEESPESEITDTKLPVVAPLAAEESSSDVSISSGVNSLAREIITGVINAAKETVLDQEPGSDGVHGIDTKLDEPVDSSLSEKTSSSEKLKKYSMLDSPTSSSENVPVIDLCSPDLLKLENIPIIDLCSPTSPEFEFKKDAFLCEKNEATTISKPEVESNVPLEFSEQSDFILELSPASEVSGEKKLEMVNQTVELEDSFENALETSLSGEILKNNIQEKPKFDDSFVTIRKKKKYPREDGFSWDSDTDVSLPLCFGASYIEEEIDLSKDGIYHADVVQAVDSELVEISNTVINHEIDLGVENKNSKNVFNGKVVAALDSKIIEHVDTEKVNPINSESKKELGLASDFISSETDSKIKHPVEIVSNLDYHSTNILKQISGSETSLISHEEADAKLSPSVPKNVKFNASPAKPLNEKKEDIKLNLSSQECFACTDASDNVCDKVTKEGFPKSPLTLSDGKPKLSKGINSKEENKYKGYSGSFAEKVRPKSLFCDALYLRSLDINLKQPFSNLTKSDDKIVDHSKTDYDDKIKKKLFSDSIDSLDIDDKDNDVFENPEDNKTEEKLCDIPEKIPNTCLKIEAEEISNKHKDPSVLEISSKHKDHSAHKHPSVSFSAVEAYSDLVSPYTSAQVTTSENTFPTKVRPKCDMDINKLRQKREKRKSVHEDIQGLPFADEEKIVSPIDPIGNSDVFMTPKTTFNENVKSTSKSSDNEVFFTPAWKAADLVDEERYLRLQSTAEQEKARQEARARARLKSDEELGLSPNNYRKKYKRQLSLNSINYDELCSDEFNDQEDEIEDDIINSFCQNKNSGIEETFSMFKNSELYLKGKNPEPTATSSQSFQPKIVKASLNDLSLLGSNISPPDKVMSASTGTLKFDSKTENDISKNTSFMHTSMHSSKISSPETSPDVICADISPFDSKFSNKIKGKSGRESSGDDDKSKSNGKKSIFSILNFGKGNLSKEKPKQKSKDSEKELSSSLPNDFGARSLSKSKPFSHLKLSKSKEKTTKPPKVKPVPSEDVPICPLENTPTQEDPLVLSLNTHQAKIIPKYAVYRNPETMISTFPVHLPVPKMENGLAPKASEDSFSDEDETKGNKASAIPNVEKNDKISSEKQKKAQRIVQKVQRQQVLKRLRNAQEIQRRLEELEVEQRDLESRGVELEKMLRNERHEGENKKGEADLMQEWYSLLHTKNKLMREEQELLIRLKDLELEDRQIKLQQDMRERMAQTDLKDAAQIKQEREILTEMLEIVEKRNELVAMLDQLRLREMEEEKNIHSEVFTKGMKSPLSPVGKS